MNEATCNLLETIGAACILAAVLGAVALEAIRHHREQKRRTKELLEAGVLL